MTVCPARNARKDVNGHTCCVEPSKPLITTPRTDFLTKVTLEGVQATYPRERGANRYKSHLEFLSQVLCQSLLRSELTVTDVPCRTSDSVYRNGI